MARLLEQTHKRHVKVHKEDFHVSLGNELMQFAGFVNALKDEQAEDDSRDYYYS